MKINNTEKKNGEHTDLIIYCVVVFLGFLVISQRLKIEPTQRTEVSPDATAKRTEKGSLKLAILASDSSRGRDIFLDGSPLRGTSDGCLGCSRAQIGRSLLPPPPSDTYVVILL